MLLVPVGLLVADQAGPRIVTRSPHGTLDIPCENCHTATSWKPLRNVVEFDHNKTKFPLRALHQSVTCSECHVSMVFSNVGTKCADCHADIHNKGQLGQNCEECHTVRGWQVSSKAIKNHQNRFPLVGAHAAVTCDECHKGLAVSKYQHMSTDCVSCHAQQFSGAKPDHHVLQFPATCDSCHNMDSWMGAKFDHAKFTGYALTGMHATLECTACHINNVYQPTATNCSNCHLKDFTATRNPDHRQAGFSQDCATCHNTASWLSVTFNHNLTTFPLTGAHVSLQCTQCHVNNNYNLTSKDCSSCHMPDFKRATNPNHVQSGFPTGCDRCHNTTSWANAAFDHSATGFTLTGAHTSLQCQQCHVNGNYNLTSANTSCVNCHLTNFRATTNPSHAQLGFSQACEQCHSTVTWANAKFDHSLTNFPLTGAHATLQCSLCHVNNNFNLKDTSCVSCHLRDFKGTTAPNHVQAGMPTACQECHTTTSWAGASFDHTKTGFPLTGAHTRVLCGLCHVNGNYHLTAANAECAACHLTNYNKTTDPNHVQAGFPTACQQCHTTTSWGSATFNHSSTGFTLTGAHTSLQCKQCHVNGNYHLTSANTTCVSCHLANFQKTTNPNHVQMGFSQACNQCHNTVSWANATFNHSTTGFPLTGAHSSVHCALCHVNNNYNLRDTSCVSCHLRDFQGTTNPNHVRQGFPTACQQCHSTTSWANATFNHNSTGFPLTGAHTTVLCGLCHVNGNYHLTAANTACVACHLTNYNKTTDPNHVQAGFPTACQQCHTTTSWGDATFNHASTGFTLTGAHTSLQCLQCHVNGNYHLTSANTTCVSCHLANFQGTTNPNHVQLGFSQACNQCHSTVSWANATFNHNATGFPLTGAHTSVLCALCHVNGNYHLTAANAACVACHLTNFNNAKDPDHVQAGFPTACQQCHNTTSWGGANFNHASTGFTLTGAHTSLQCQQCHVNGNYHLTSANTTCVSCHLGDFQRTNNPNHVQMGFPQACNQCHSTVSWANAKFNHNTTGFPLTGAHTSVQCAQCHVNNNYNLHNTTCVSCHLRDFQGTTNPNHVQQGFPTACQQCHTTTSWGNANFNHTSTGFPLTGAHTSVLCGLCHVNSNYHLTAANAACVACHLANYNGTTDPNHAQAGFPTTCQQCHNTTSWGDATFNHSSTGFTLTGAHTSLHCQQCHVNGNYHLTSANTTCISCHLADFNRTTNPNHVQMGFPQACNQCHSTVSWANATFNHNATGFPLTGAHTSLQCAQCHVNGNYNLHNSTCVTCHLRDYQGTTDPNHAQQGFPTACQQCHTTTSWGDANFNHSSTGFPLTGAHTTLLCALCHVSGNYHLTAANATCVACHLTNYNNTTDPNHAQAGFPTTCQQCHTTTSWGDANFNHTSTGFALTGAHTSVPCLQCHVGANFHLTSANAACYSCHQANYTSANNPSHVAAGFPRDCSVCHSTVNWSGATFNHATTGFTLTGAHTAVACLHCHVNNNYSLTSANTACYSCHKNNFTGTTNPNHVAAGFPTDCTICHNTTSWSGAVFNHNNTPFPLTGAHVSVSCTSCHLNNVFAGTPTACYACQAGFPTACHKVDYQGTTNPNHAAAGFPTTCQTCHTTTSWSGANFNHTWFPIPHANARLCSDCHTNSSNYTVFTCTSCHTKSQTDPQHQGVRGYVWNSVNCYACHRNGNGG